MNTILHKAASRGHANHGWLNTYHSFSFADYYNRDRMNFGVLRVINDDTIEAGRGFGEHPHNNMEIITIPLEGDLAHKDSMGNAEIIRQGDIQVMSAGSGIFHSEFNANSDSKVSLLQIWIFPNAKNVNPRYDQITLKDLENKNKLVQILSPNPMDDGVWIYQNVWFNLGNFDADIKFEYNLKNRENGVYAFIIEGEVIVEDQFLNRRDGFGLWNMTSIRFRTNTEARILIMEVPMQL
jgi:quercetin 2,3-dioxygenase